jgi:hypothetical protein
MELGTALKREHVLRLHTIADIDVCLVCHEIGLDDIGIIINVDDLWNLIRTASGRGLRRFLAEHKQHEPEDNDETYPPTAPFHNFRRMTR